MHRIYVPDAVKTLLDAIYANLADDGPRLVYADQLQEAGEPRGEFIAVQCELARLGYAVKAASWDWIGDALADDEADPAHIRKLRARETKLLKVHGESWLAEAKKVNPRYSLQTLRFERGFVTHLESGASAEAANVHSTLLQAFPTLDSIDLWVRREEVAKVFEWPGLVQLRALQMPVHAIPGLVTRRAVKLRELSLTCTDRRDFPLVRELFDWAGFEGITALDISGAALTAGDAAKLVASCGPLDELQLRAAKLGPEGAAAIAGAKHLANLRVLSLIGNGLGCKGVASLMKLKKLRAIDLRKNKVGVEGATALGGHPALRTIDLTGNTVTAEMLEALGGGKGLGELRELCLQATHVDDDALAVLAASPLLARLTNLNLRSNKITDKGAKLLATSKHAANLRAINLNNNEITAAGKQALDGSKFFATARVTLR